MHGALPRIVSALTRSGRLEIAILAAVLAAVLGLWIFGVLGAEVVEGDTGKFDEQLLLACREPGNLAVPIRPKLDAARGPRRDGARPARGGPVAADGHHRGVSLLGRALRVTDVPARHRGERARR